MVKSTAEKLEGTDAVTGVVLTSGEKLPADVVVVGIVFKRFEQKGVRVMVKSTAEKLEGTDTVTGVVLTSGEKLPADVVVVGIGIVPPTEWLKKTRIELDERGFIVVDDHFRTTADFVYAIGDAVSAPLPLWDIDNINIQHFQVAQTHGQLLAYSIIGRPYPTQLIPFFWTVFFFEFGIRYAGQLLAYSIIGRPYPTQLIPFFWTVFFFEFGIRYAGCAEGASNVILHGSLADINFAKYYLKDDVVVAVANAGPTPTAIQFLEIFKRKIKVTREDVEKNTSDDWMALLNE
ncbi:unnamed protein product [Strongylus vulgaris]|uniref:FAD/NAD(P)-binding domain-containing protein n=1 Tax=Strongylus vulgaris TaxID=40348 RepID=A0A3P7LQK2_STRVU|nr:unnamed protein product [Strongylus vulgaris]